MNLDKALEKIESLENDIEKLSTTNDELSQTIDELKGEAADRVSEVNELHEASFDVEEVAEKAFNAGFEACENKEAVMRSWLNYKIGARI